MELNRKQVMLILNLSFILIFLFKIFTFYGDVGTEILNNDGVRYIVTSEFRTNQVLTQLLPFFIFFLLLINSAYILKYTDIGKKLVKQ